MKREIDEIKEAEMDDIHRNIEDLWKERNKIARTFKGLMEHIPPRKVKKTVIECPLCGAELGYFHSACKLSCRNCYYETEK